jgi:hypothetical protein
VEEEVVAGMVTVATRARKWDVAMEEEEEGEGEEKEEEEEDFLSYQLPRIHCE